MSKQLRRVRRWSQRLKRLAPRGALMVGLLAQFGCGREFFRQWANLDVTEAVFEKSRDPRFRLEMFSIDPPAMSRFANPYDPDHPPAPPDDPAAEALSPVPQQPKFRLLVPMEGTGYIEMLEAWDQERKALGLDETATDSADDDRPKPEAEGEGREGGSSRRPSQDPSLLPGPDDAPRDVERDLEEFPPGAEVPNPEMDMDLDMEGVPSPIPSPGPGPGPESDLPPTPTPLPTGSGAAGPGVPGPSAGAEAPLVEEALRPTGLSEAGGIDDFSGSPPRIGILPPASSGELRPIPNPEEGFSGGGAGLPAFEAPSIPEPSASGAGSGNRSWNRGSLDDAVKVGPAAELTSLNEVGGDDRVGASSAPILRHDERRRDSSVNLSAFQTLNLGDSGSAGIGVSEGAASSPGRVAPLPISLEVLEAQDPDPETMPELGSQPPEGVEDPALSPMDRPAFPGADDLPEALRDRNGEDEPVSDASADDPDRKRIEVSPSDIYYSNRTYTERDVLGIGKDSRLYTINMEQAMTLALINSRGYQTQLEQIYLSSLPVTLQRFNLQPQVYAGLSPTTGTAAGIGTNPANRYNFRSSEAAGGNQSLLNLGTAAGVGKVFAGGTRALLGFANQVIFNFSGSNPRVPTIQSTIPIQFVIPLLRGAGRAVVLENLTSAERDLLYQIRTFTRFRQQFFTSVLVGGAGAPGGAGVADPTVGFLPLLQQFLVAENNLRNVRELEQFLLKYSELAKGAPSGISEREVNLVRQNLLSSKASLIQIVVNLRNQMDSYKIQLGLPPDIPLTLDRSVISDFQTPFRKIERWSQLDDQSRDFELVEGYLEELPKLPDVVIDGYSLAAMVENPDLTDDTLMAAQRVALENRLDLMNTRAELYDAWRQLKVTSNALLGTLNISGGYQLFTPPGNQNIMGFNSQTNEFNVSLNAELPLIRVQERNQYQVSRINYQRAQRALQSQEDSIKLTIRQQIRQLIQLREQYELTRSNFGLAIRNVDNTSLQINQPAGAGGTSAAASQQLAQTQNLLQQQNTVLNTQNQLVNIWVQYQQARLNLYRDLGTMPYDEWEAYYELFAPNRSQGPGSDGSSQPELGSPADADGAGEAGGFGAGGAAADSGAE